MTKPLRKCPASKRHYIVVDDSRRSEFQNKVIVEERIEHKVSFELKGSDLRYSISRFNEEAFWPARVFDYLHTHYPKPHQWRIVVGIKGKRRPILRDWVRIRWIAIQFNSDEDAVHFKLAFA